MRAPMSRKALAWLEMAKEKLSPDLEWAEESKERIIERSREEEQNLDSWDMVKIDSGK